MQYSINFTLEEMLSSFKKFPKDNLVIIRHELLGIFDHVLDCTNAFVTTEEKFEKLWGKTPEKNQINYVKKFNKQIQSTALSLNQVLSSLSHNSISRLNELCLNSYNNLNNIINYLPLQNKIKNQQSIDPKRKEMLKEVDAYLNCCFYAYNNLFSSNAQKEFFDLKEDIRKYFIFRQNNESYIHMHLPNIDYIHTKADFFTYAVLPLIKNIEEHAFNKDNDIFNRYNADFCKYFDVDNLIEEQNILLIIKDNGFGIRDKIYEKLFAAGNSSKNKIGHGIGLWAVKKFCVENGAQITCKSELGNFTQFEIRIPYYSAIGSIFKCYSE